MWKYYLSIRESKGKFIPAHGTEIYVAINPQGNQKNALLCSTNVLHYITESST
jgi:hypothetical protein